MKIDESGYPMMARQEVEFLRNLIDEHKFETCLEWGSGNSTIYFSKECKSIKQWVSVEHNGNYLTYMKDKVDKSKVTTIWVPETEWYIDCVKHEGRKYDFILVDGLMRDKCLEAALTLGKERRCIIAVHDTGRKEYQSWISRYPHKKIFDGEKQLSDGSYAHRGLTLFYV